MVQLVDINIRSCQCPIYPLHSRRSLEQKLSQPQLWIIKTGKRLPLNDMSFKDMVASKAFMNIAEIFFNAGSFDFKQQISSWLALIPTSSSCFTEHSAKL